MTFLKKFAIMCFIVLASFGFMAFMVITNQLENGALLRAQELTASFIQQEGNNEFSLGELRKPKYGEEYELFSQKLEHLSLGPRMLHVRIWNSDKEIIWADDVNLVGKTFPDNHELTAALEGHVEVKLSHLDKEEHENIDTPERLMELYVPIFFDGKVGAVFEVYENLDPLLKDTGHQRNIILYGTLAGTLGTFLILYSLVASASHRINIQNQLIAKSEEQIRGLLTAATDAIVSVDLSWNIVMANTSARNIFAINPDDVAKPRFLNLFTEKSRQRIAQATNKLFDGQSNDVDDIFDVECYSGVNNVFPATATLSASGDGEDTIVTAFLRDLTERKAIQNQLVKSEKQATATIMASSIGHELNNSVTALLGYAEMLAEDPSDVKFATRASEVFLLQSQSLAAHAMDLLELGKPREPRFESVNIVNFMDNLTAMMKDSGVLKRFSIKKNYQEQIPLIYGDKGLLEQVFRNLQINAAHAMGDSGTITVRIEKQEGKAVEVSIEDTGHGIPEDLLPHIFEPFNTSKSEKGGTGLGLHIAKHIVNEHGGTISISSSKGYWTKVKVSLPSMEAGFH